jgi:hypothetical protein
VLANLELDINSIERLAVEGTIQAPHNDKIRLLRISVRFIIVDASLQSWRLDIVTGRAVADDAHCPTPIASTTSTLPRSSSPASLAT